MIGKTGLGKGAAGLIAYCMQEKLDGLEKYKKKEHVLRGELIYHQGFSTAQMRDLKSGIVNPNALANEFNKVAKMNTKTNKFLWHQTLSFHPDDKIDNNLMRAIVKDFAEKYGFADNQLLAIRHNDTAHSHVHIIANRIDLSTGKNTATDKMNYRKNEDFCRQMEKKYGLKPLEDYEQVKQLHQEVQMVLDSKGPLVEFSEALEKSWKIHIPDIFPKNFNEKQRRIAEIEYILKEGIGKVTSLNELKELMNANGYNLYSKVGLVFRNSHQGHIAVNESDLSKNYSYESIKSTIEINVIRKIKPIIDSTIPFCTSIKDFVREMEKNRIGVRMERGISFYLLDGKEPVIIKGSDVSREYSLNGIKDQIKTNFITTQFDSILSQAVLNSARPIHLHDFSFNDKLVLVNKNALTAKALTLSQVESTIMAGRFNQPKQEAYEKASRIINESNLWKLIPKDSHQVVRDGLRLVNENHKQTSMSFLSSWTLFHQTLLTNGVDLGVSNREAIEFILRDCISPKQKIQTSESEGAAGDKFSSIWQLYKNAIREEGVRPVLKFQTLKGYSKVNEHSDLLNKLITAMPLGKFTARDLPTFIKQIAKETQGKHTITDTVSPTTRILKMEDFQQVSSLRLTIDSVVAKMPPMGKTDSYIDKFAVLTHFSEELNRHGIKVVIPPVGIDSNGNILGISFLIQNPKDEHAFVQVPGSYLGNEYSAQSLLNRFGRVDQTLIPIAEDLSEVTIHDRLRNLTSDFEPDIHPKRVYGEEESDMAKIAKALRQTRPRRSRGV
ncbi:relaxase/mobilization nuclease domain-containing protein [Siphonobacter sp. SORGH_AS_1065]|uniref:relaxase/mobilization nuclease domain-containing protein n=1 Tax=Siphonobacter sp. SORGH_AS_1065 TaxID=3041795 RepID=UPI0027822FA1|nr:relaxase/mobilization nuclease domain-containing protein [Siphonobacter sp. SORGH_AS_1065]MDQ1090455.1 hypothetical protein [Siphonobacter sp. SORGH_AS_1065]